MHPAALLLVAAVQARALGQRVVAAQGHAAAAVAGHAAFGLAAQAEAFGQPISRAELDAVAGQPGAGGQAGRRRGQAALRDDGQAGGRVDRLVAVAQGAAARAAADAAGQPQRLLVGPGQRAIALRADGFAGAADAAVQRQPLGRQPAQADAEGLPVAAARLAVFALLGFAVELQRRVELDRAADVGLFAAAIQRRGRVVEQRRGLAVVSARLGAVAFVRQLGPDGLAGDVADAVRQRAGRRLVGRVGVDVAGALCAFDHQRRARRQLDGDVGAAELIGRQRVLVLHQRATDFQLRVQLPLAVDPADPEGRAALVDLVGHAQRHRVQVVVDAGQEAGQQDAAREGLEGVVHQPLQGPHADDARGLVAVAHQHLDLLAAFQHAVVAQAVGARALAGDFLDHLAQRVAEGEGVAGDSAFLMVQAHPGGGAVVVAQAALLQRRDRTLADRLAVTVAGDEVAVERVALVLVDAHVEPVAGPGVEAAQRGVAVDRVDLVGPHIAQQAGAGGLVAVVGRGQQQVAADRALQVEGRARGHAVLAVVELARPVLDFLLEAVVGARLRQRATTAEIDDAFDQAGGDHRPQFGHEADDASRFLATGGDAHAHVLRLGRRQQGEGGAAAFDLQLHAGRRAVGVLPARPEFVGARARQQHAAARVFDGHEDAVGQRLAVLAVELDGQLDGRLAVGGDGVAVDLDQQATDRAVGSVMDAGLFAAEDRRRLRVDARRARVERGVAGGAGRVAHVGG